MSPTPSVPGDEVQQFFLTKGERVLYASNEVIINPNGILPGVFYISSGFVRAFTPTHYGHNNQLVVHKPGEIFPLPWALNKHGIEIFYHAMNSLVLLRVTKKTFQQHFRTSALFAQAVTEQLLNILYIYERRIQNLELRTARERVIFRLVDMAARFGVARPNGEIFIDAPLTHQDIANSTNTSRETTSRIMESLAAESIIDQNQHLLVIKRLDTLIQSIG